MRKLLEKSTMMMLLVLLLVPSLANATTYWAITASTSPTALKASLSAARPANFGNYTTPGGAGTTNVIKSTVTTVNYTVSVPAGYSLVNVKVDGVIKGTTAGTYPVAKGTLLNHSIAATYSATSYTITTQVAPGGNISASVSYAGSAPITLTPISGYFLSGAVIDNVSYALDATLPAFVTKTGTAAGATYSFNTGSHTIKGVFGQSPTASAIISTPSQSVVVGATGIVVDGSTSSSNVAGASYLWSASCGSVTPTAPNAKTASYSAPATAGNCTVTLTVSAAGVSPNPQASVVFAASSAVQASTNNCLACHDGVNGPGVPGFTSSPHFGVTSCADCHNPGQALSHPFAALAGMGNVCASCHSDGQGNVPGHPFAIGAYACVFCHNAHTTAGTLPGMPTGIHYNNITSGAYPASFVTSKASCADCHFDSPANLAIRQQWFTSAHAKINDAPFTAYDFKTRSGCVQCHTTTGFIAYSTGKVTAAWGVAADKTKEVITCVACHKDITTGALRSVAPVRPYAGEPGYLNRNVGKSNICLDCHSGLNNGTSILNLVGSANFAAQAFIPPHYLAAGGTLHGKGGYNFPGQGYAFYSSNSHRAVGIANNAATGSAGPCIACHKNSDSGHRFQSGAGALCNNCHGSAMPAATLAQNQAGFSTGLTVLNAMLKDQGYLYSANYPYFSNTSWGTGQAGANVMGAAFNYVLLLKEPGAYAHNPAYAKQLISDSIDCVYHGGTVTGSIDSALAYLVGKGAISQQDSDDLKNYKSSTGCTSCHVANSGSHVAHLEQAVSCSSCHNATAASNASLVPGTASHANGVVDVVINGGGSYSGGLAGTCSNVYCHSDGRGTTQNVVWGSGKLTCRACHPTLGGSHAKHVGNLFDGASFNSYTGNYSTGSMYRFGCSNCHPIGTGSHLNGRIDLALAPDPAAGTLRNLNDPNSANTGIGNSGSGITGSSRVSVVCSTSYCHSNGWSGTTLAYAASPDWYNPGAYTGDRCAMCHGNSPNTGVPGSPAHTVHVVGIHSLNVFSGGFGNLTTGSTGNVGHGIAAQSTTLNCNVCHNDTVSSARNDGGLACVGCHSNQGNPAQIANKALHVNGRVEVSFANISVVSKAQLRPASFAPYSGAYWTRNGGYKAGAASFDSSKQTLKHAASFEGGGCSNVACHMGQPVQWTDTNSPSYCALCHTAL
jgi:predicted CxxxxCH...CXXCH cytochrome family protein